MIILIGNGSSVLDKELGVEIDQFDRVVRFNSYKIEGFEKFVGTKTTDWYNVQYYTPENPRLKKTYERYAFHSWAWGGRDERYIKMEENITAKTKDFVKKETILEMADFCQDPSYKWFSTGAIAAWMYLKEYGKITLYGFDWWNRQKHHYADNEVRGSLHKPEKELLFFEKLGGKVRFL
jgi:hypothetical protein